MTNYLKSYIGTALWSSCDDFEEPLDSNYDYADISKETLEVMQKECDEFILKAGELLDGLDLEIVMHDFWLTRNRHGAGFWDGDYPKEIGNKLTDIAQSFGEVWLYIGDDLKIYQSN